jgi:hypothetical protein
MALNRNSRRKLLLIIGLMFVVVTIIIVATRSSDNDPSNPTNTSGCLNKSDYKDLTGTTPAELDVGNGFYTYAIEFDGTSTSYSTDNSPSAPDIIKNIGSFYQSHKHKSILITLSSINSNSTGAETATERLQQIKDGLVANGVSESAITVDEPALTDTEPGTNDIATIAIATKQGCQ